MRHGFSFVEIMIVCLIYGTFAAVAMPGFSDYQDNVKNSEAKINLKSIANGALAFYMAEHSDDAGLKLYYNIYPNCGVNFNDDDVAITGCKAGANPIGRPSAEDTVNVQFNPNDYRNALASDPWKSLRFDISTPFWYYYDYVSNDGGKDASAFSAKASASLRKKCDSIFVINGQPSGSVSPIIDMSDDPSVCNTAALPN